MSKTGQKLITAITVGVLVSTFVSWTPVVAQIATPTAVSEQTIATVLTTETTTPEPPAADLSSGNIDWTDPAMFDPEDWPTLEQVAAKSYVVIDRLSGAVLIGQNENTPQYPASTTKIMTALLALENLSLDQTITASEAAVKLPWDASKAGFLAGETTTVRDALAGLMLPSGNDAANMLAEAISGDLAAFAEYMNQQALELGAATAHFVNANGLHDETHQISAADMALITARAMQYPAFRELVDAPVYAMAATDKHPYNGWGIYANSNNRLLLALNGNYSSPWLEKVTGVKTGTTSAAGQCLVTAATTVAGQELICVLFGVDAKDLSGNPVNYTRTLLEAAAQKVASTEQNQILTKDQAIDIPGSDQQALPTRSLVVAAHDDRQPELELDWKMVSDTITVVQDGRIVLTIPYEVVTKPVVSPLDLLIGHETGTTSGSSQSNAGPPSILEWPGLKPLFIIFGFCFGLVIAFSIGLSIGRRRSRRAQVRRPNLPQ